MQKRSGIYRIDLGNGNFYIGSAVDIAKREYRHRSDLKHEVHGNIRMQRCWDKNGVFEFTVLEECVKDDLIVREQFYLDQHCDNPKNVNLVSTAGSCLGYKHSAESRANMSAGMMGHVVSDKARANMSGRVWSAESRAKSSASHKGVPKSAEHRAKISAALRGKKPSDETRAKMSKPKSAEHRAKISAGGKGKILSAEHRAKISTALVGRKHSVEVRAKMSATRRRNRCER